MSKGRLRAIRIMRDNDERGALLVVRQSSAGLRRKVLRPAVGKTLRDLLKSLAVTPQQ